MRKLKAIGAILSVVLTFFSCRTTPPYHPVAKGKTEFHWLFQENKEFQWDLVIPSTQNYVLTMKISNSADEEKVIGVRTDCGHFVRKRIAPGDNDQTFWIADFLLMTGPLRLSLEGMDGDLKLEQLRIDHTFPLKRGEIDKTPINPQASDEVRQLLAYLADINGKGILSGQMDLTWDDSINMEDRVFQYTGQRPALMGFDFMNYKYPGDGGSGKKQVEEAITFASKGGIVTFCWHWRMGKENAFYTKKTDFRINRDPQSKEYRALIDDIDRVSLLLQELQKRGIPVLWRPLHEASGGWFWWGATGPEDYLFLWNLLYERMTDVHKLNNLIWVWNGQDKQWYPGDDKVDIIGVDIYKGKGDHSSQIGAYAEAQSYVEGDKLKLIALTENGSIPDPQLLADEKVPWSWFMTWNDNNKNAPDDFFSGNLWNSHEDKRAFFNHPYVINLEDLK